MKRIALSVLACAMATAPAMSEPAPKTQLVASDGASVTVMRLREGASYSAWVIDKRNVLYRDEVQDYYLVTLQQPCEPLGIRHRAFAFHPAAPARLKATSTYQLRPAGGASCDVARIEKIDAARATPLRDASLWRVW